MSQRDKFQAFDRRVTPTALPVSKAVDGPYVVEVLNGQWEVDPGRKTLVIHVIPRPGIARERAMAVMQHALVDVFGQVPPGPCHLDYYDPLEIHGGLGTKPILGTMSLTAIFFPGVVVDTRRPDTVRDQMAAAMVRWHEASAGW